MTLDLKIMMKFTQVTQNILIVCIQVDRNSLEATISLSKPRYLVSNLNNLMPGRLNTCPDRKHLVSNFWPLSQMCCWSISVTAIFYEMVMVNLVSTLDPHLSGFSLQYNAEI